MTIEGYVGDPGQGKTYLMVKRAHKLQSRKKNPREIWANFDFKGANRYRQLDEVFHVKNAVILVDEISLVAPAGFWKSIPFEVMAYWRQHRHYGVDVYFTAQDFMDIATPIRRVTQFVNEVNKFGPFFFYKCYHPRKKIKYGGGIALFDKEIGNIYDTHGEDVTRQDFLKDV